MATRLILDQKSPGSSPGEAADFKGVFNTLVVSNTGQPVDISIYSVTGQLVIRNHALEAESAMDIGTLEQGIYIIHITNGAIRKSGNYL